MAIIVVEQGSPATASVTTPTLNFQHFSTPHGILQLVQFVIAIIIFCIGSPIWLTIVSWIAWIVTHLSIWIYLFSLNVRYTSNPPLNIVEFYFAAITTILYALCTLLGFIFIFWISGIFALANTVAYGMLAFLLLKDWKAYRGEQQNIPK